MIELNGGGPLTDFEKKLVSEFDPNQARTTLGLPTVTPIKGVHPKGEEMSKEVQAYKVTYGGSGDRETKYYDRNGNVLRDKGMTGGTAESEGLGPLEYVGYAQLGSIWSPRWLGKLLRSSRQKKLDH